jgi:hypothetical protein
MKYLLLLILLLLVAIPAFAQEPPSLTANAMTITVMDCTTPPSRGGHVHVYINYTGEKYQQAVTLTPAAVVDYCQIYHSGAWYHSCAGEATIVSAVIEYDGGGYTTIGGLPVALDVAYLPMVMR